MSADAQDHADTIREALSVLYGNGSYRFMHESDKARKEANSALDALVVENQQQAIELEGLRNEYGARVEERDRAEAKNRRLSDALEQVRDWPLERSRFECSKFAARTLEGSWGEAMLDA